MRPRDRGSVTCWLSCYVASACFFVAWITGALSSFRGTVDGCSGDASKGTLLADAPHNGVWLASLPVRTQKLGYGVLGLEGRMGFEGRCVSIGGVGRVHSVGMVSGVAVYLYLRTNET
jgi:hypothetical protein